MKFGIIIAAICVLILGIKPLEARTRSFPLAADIERVEPPRVMRGDTIIIASDSVWLVTTKAYTKIIGLQVKYDSVTTLQSAQIEIAGLTLRHYDTLTRSFKVIDSIQQCSFDSLLVLRKRTDTLLTRSIRNTEKAVRQSFFTAILLGGLAGFTIPRDQPVQTNIMSAIIGAGVGAVVNYFIFK